MEEGEVALQVAEGVAREHSAAVGLLIKVLNYFSALLANTLLCLFVQGFEVALEVEVHAQVVDVSEVFAQGRHFLVLELTLLKGFPIGLGVREGEGDLGLICKKILFINRRHQSAPLNSLLFCERVLRESPEVEVRALRLEVQEIFSFV